METTEKIIIYQVFTRLFGNQNKTCRPNGSLEENGCGKMNDFTKQALHEIKKLGATHCERESRLSVCHPRLL